MSARHREGAARRRELLVDAEAQRLAAHAKLSWQETEVFRRIAQGARAPEIADQMRIGMATFRSHAHHVYEKLGVDDAEHARLKLQDDLI